MNRTKFKDYTIEESETERKTIFNMPSPPDVKIISFVLKSTRTAINKLENESYQYEKAQKLYEYLLNKLPHGIFNKFSDLIIEHRERVAK